jgi:hypothetical protein
VTSENSENPVHGDDSEVQAERKASVQIDDPKPEVPLVTARPQAAPSKHHCEITCKAKRDWIDKATLGLEAFGLFVLIIYASATIAIWCANKKAADAAKSSADTANLTLQLNQQQFRTDQRPYIWGEAVAAGQAINPTERAVVNNLPDGTYQIAIGIIVKNGGKSPAKNVLFTRSEVIFGPTEQATREARNFVPHYAESIGTIYPPNMMGMVKNSPYPVFNATQFSKLGHGTWKLYVVGAISYRDIFEPQISPYETHYCIEYAPIGLPFGNCGFGNSIN